MIPMDVSAYIARKFAPGDQQPATALLSTATIENGTLATPRLIRCAAIASDGSLERLAAEVERLKADWRDVVVAGEYEVLEGTLERVRDLNDPIPADT
jgi:limonene-1,2-epoxide hydrolase